MIASRWRTSKILSKEGAQADRLDELSQCSTPRRCEREVVRAYGEAVARTEALSGLRRSAGCLPRFVTVLGPVPTELLCSGSGLVPLSVSFARW